ncbi:PIG-U-domain-containing protein [Gigaspora margarita]|uniref:PIG-U-domain-containing protein n=1 Tax=Gigaspora margarita TaxID=4874 RepID=A0A8H4EHD2_GIGMA|nr:PIG-U-domain-containing protein [Gigaspora margarita]
MSKVRQELKTIEVLPNLTGVIIFGVAFAIRFILFQFSNITEILGNRVEIVTPVTSFTRLTEGLYLFDNGVPPYDGGAFHQAPLFLACFQLLSYLPNILIPLTYIIADLLIAYLLANITRIKQHLYKDFPRIDVELYEGKPKEIDPWIVSGLYLFNPLTVASCLSRSTLLFTNLSVVLGTYYSLRNNKSYGMFWIAMATYLSFYPLMLVIPSILMLTNNTNLKGKKIENEVYSCAGLYIGWLTGLFILSYLLVDSWDFMQSTYGVILLLPDLTPNIGLFWYFFIEMFDQFRSFFLVVFQLHAFIFVVPISIKFRNHPLFVVFLLSGIMAVFKSYPSIGDASLYLAFLPIYSEIVKYMRYNYLTTNIFCYCSILSPIFYHLWIYAGSGNANFFYAITLVYTVGNIILLVDSTFSMLRREFDIWNPELRHCEITQK